MEILVPISLGELYDKLSILTIKSEHIEDKEKLQNVEKEFQLLNSIAEKYEIDPVYWYDLLRVNQHIWNVEDSIRNKEAKQEFDKEFIELARDVYFSNDKRAKMKKAINTEYGSDVVEEKSYQKY